MVDILDELRDLQKQATTERSHYYVASVANKAIAEIERLRSQLERSLVAGERLIAMMGGHK